MASLLVEGVERIAVLRTGGLGGLLLGLPALEALRRAYPAAKITLLGTEWHARVFQARPGPVDEVIALPPIAGVTSGAALSDAPPGSMPDLPELQVEGLRRRCFDVALQMQGGGLAANSFVRDLGARVSAGACAPDAVRLDRWVPYVDYQHETLRFLEVAGLVGAPACAIEPKVSVLRDDWAELDETMSPVPRGLIAIHPGGRDPRCRWPAECFAEVADRLGRPVVVTGDEHERGLVERVIAAMKRPARALIGTLSFGGLAALYAACDVLITNDTGHRHLAAATGTPTAAVYWCGSVINAGPLTRRHHRPLISWRISCPVCGRSGMERGMPSCGHDVSWVSDVPVDDVLDQVHDLLR